MLFQRGDTLVVALELGETVLRFVLKVDDVFERVAVLSTQVAKKLASFTDVWKRELNRESPE